MDNVKDIPLVPPVSPIARMEPSDNDTLRNGERNQSEHQALVTTFAAQALPDAPITRSIPEEEKSLLIYAYDRRTQQIKPIKN